MTARHDIHRRLDGSIDIDFYRHKGLMERRLVISGFFEGVGKPLAAATLAAVMLYAVAPRGTSAVDAATAPTSITR